MMRALPLWYVQDKRLDTLIVPDVIQHILIEWVFWFDRRRFCISD